jgi:hypothetical protein
VVYFTTLSVVQDIYCRIITQLINNELERIWKDKFEVLFWHFDGIYEENHKISFIIAVVPFEIRNEHDPNT